MKFSYDSELVDLFGELVNLREKI